MTRRSRNAGTRQWQLRTCASAVALLLVHVSAAQITLDGTLGPKQALNGPDYVIPAEDGRQVGNNLFHSFGEFNIQKNQSATFTGPRSIDNVIGRVTGGNMSVIDGRLSCDIPDANLYLINPSGVMFGPDATLDVQGSFAVSSADYVRLGDNGRFDAIHPEQSVLTTAPPAAFGFLSEHPAPISVNKSFLTVPEGKTLSMIGGNINIVGGSGDTEGLISAPGGRVDIASVASAGEVVPNRGGEAADLDVSGFQRLGSIRMSDQAGVDVSGDPGGTVVIRSGRLALQSSAIVDDSTGDRDSNALSISASTLTLDDAVIESNTSGMGRGANIAIAADDLQLTGGSQVHAQTEGVGQSGDVTIKASRTIDISGDPKLSYYTGVIADSPSGGGNLGKISITAPHLNMDTGTILSSADSGGRSGDVVIDVGGLAMTGSSSIQDVASTAEQAGDLMINASGSVTLRGQGRDIEAPWIGNASSPLFLSAEAGRVSIVASDLVMEGGRIDASGYYDTPSGSVMVDVGRLSMDNGALITTESNGTGRGGDITINARTLSISGGDLDNHASQISAASLGTAGRAGDITIHVTETIDISKESPQIGLVFDGVGIYSGTVQNQAGGGDAGALSIHAGAVAMDGGNILSATGGSGQGGDLTLAVGQLTMAGGAQLQAGTFGAGASGDVIIHATDAVSLTGRDTAIAAVTNGGPAGSVRIDARRLALADGSAISTGSGGPEDAGTIVIHVLDDIQSTGSLISTGAKDAHGGNISLAARDIRLDQGSQVSALAQNNGGGGNLSLDAETIVARDNSDIRADAVRGVGGNIFIRAQGFFRSPDSDVNASSQFSQQGTVTINAPDTNVSNALVPLPRSFLDAAALLPASCAARASAGSTFVVGCREALPIEPGGTLPSAPGRFTDRP